VNTMPSKSNSKPAASFAFKASPPPSCLFLKNRQESLRRVHHLHHHLAMARPPIALSRFQSPQPRAQLPVRSFAKEALWERGCYRGQRVGWVSGAGSPRPEKLLTSSELNPGSSTFWARPPPRNGPNTVRAAHLDFNALEGHTRLEL
jgi:hypothetical protein